jgi:DNA repair protein SbcD/Mre11
MRLLHVSDWHLGRLTYNRSRLPDHEMVLAETIEIAQLARPDLVLHTGDVFDGPRPSYEDVGRAVAALQELAAVAPVVVISGNHDSPALFRLLAQVQSARSRIRFVDRPLHPELGGVLELPGAEGEVVRLAPIPFVHANRLLDGFFTPESWSGDYAENMAALFRSYGAGLARGYDPRRHVLLLASHIYVQGARLSRSERPLHVGSGYMARLEQLPPVAYAAFGHIHRPQELPGTEVRGRYAGSPIPLDFGEEGESKSVVLVEATPGSRATVETVPLSGGRPLLRLQGTLEEIAARADAARGALCLVVARTETPTPGLSELVGELLPGAVLLDVQEDCEATRLAALSDEAAGSEAPEPTPSELFREYLAAGGAGASRTPPERLARVFDSLLEAVESELPPRFPEAEGLRR